MPTINPSNFTAQITKTVTPADLGFTASFAVPAGYRLVGFGEFNKFRVSEKEPDRYYINVPGHRTAPHLLITQEKFDRNPLYYPANCGFIFEKEPRIRVIFEPTGAPPKHKEYYSVGHEFIERVGLDDAAYRSDKGYTRREEIY